MSKSLYHLSLTFLFSIFFSACSGGDGNNTTLLDKDITQPPQNNTTVIDPKYYGKWVSVDSAKAVNIVSTTNINFEEVDDNLLKVDKNGVEYYLLRASFSQTKVTGKVDTAVSESAKASSYSGVGNMNVILENVLDSKIQEETTTDAQGNFEIDSLPSGEYTLTITDEEKTLESNVTIDKKTTNIGNYKLTGTDIHNFKAELILNKRFIYADTTLYRGAIRVHNISDVIGLGLNFDITLNDASALSFDVDNALGSIPPHSYKDINVSFRFKPLYENQKSLNINVLIGDVANNKWEDSFSFDIYKTPIELSLSTKSANLKGYLIFPNTNELQAINIDEGRIFVPSLNSDASYHILFSNPSLQEETAYSLGINKEALSDFSNFTNTAAHEPNDKESEATTLENNEVVTSYLHIGDLDYWKVHIAEDNMRLLDETNSSAYFQFTTIYNATPTYAFSSNEALISIDGTNTNTISLSDGTIVLNGNDTKLNTLKVKDGDKIALKVDAPTHYYDSKTITLYLPSSKKNLTLNAPEIFETDTYMWEDSKNTVAKLFNWNDANDYCENLDYGGFNDWKLPSVTALKSLATNEVKNIEYNNFNIYYWSSTYYKNLSKYMYVKYFKNSTSQGVNDGVSKSSTLYHVRCMREK